MVGLGKTSVDLVVDAAVAHLDLEGTLVTPGLVPGVHAQPVVDVVIGAPADHLDGVATVGGAGLVLVDTLLVGEEIFVDGEGGGDSAVLVDLLLDVLDASDAVAGSAQDLLVTVDEVVVGLALGLADWGNLGGVLAVVETLNFDVMSALRHGVVVAELTLAKVTSGDGSGSGEPGPWGTNLTTVAAEGEAGCAIAASSGVSNGEKSLEITVGGNAHSVVESLGGTVGPAGTAVGLVTDVVDHLEAAWPVLTSIEHNWELIGSSLPVGLFVEVNGPLRINNGSHHLADLVAGGTFELSVGGGGPSGVGVAVHI